MIEENYPQWRQELKSSQKKEGNFTSNKWIQIATITAKNEPRLRTVVFRGWLKENSMLIFTDSRSAKVKEIEANNNVEVLWFLAKSKSQFRFKGLANKVHEDLNYWNKLSQKSRSLWFWPNPGCKFNNIDYQNFQSKKVKPTNFMVYEITIHTVELLKLENPYNKRYIWEISNNWIKSRINP